MITSSHFIFGLHAVEGILKKHPKRVLRLLILQDRQDKKIESILQAAKQQAIPIDYTSRTELDHLTNEANHQGIVAFCSKAESLSENDLQAYLSQLKTPPFILLLDGITTSIVSGGALCIIGVAACCYLLPKFWRYKAN